MKRCLLLIGLFVAVGIAGAQTKTTATLTQVVNANSQIAATMKVSSAPNPSLIGQTITYTINVSGSNNGQSPTGTVTVAGLTGSQTVTLANGTATCTETPTAATPAKGTAINFTYNGDSNFF